MIIVNLFGGPGAGKSTTAAGVFHALKVKGINVELVTEYAKDLTWEDRHHALANQALILGKQFHRLWRLRDKVDVVITDSPIMLGIIYNDDRLKFLPGLIVELHQMFDSMNYILHRPDTYTDVGRNQTAEEAINIDGEIRRLLHDVGSAFDEVKADCTGLNHIVEDVLAKCS